MRLLPILLMLLCLAQAQAQEFPFDPTGPVNQEELLKMARHLEWVDGDPGYGNESAFAIRLLSASGEPAVILPILQGYLDSADVRSRILAQAMLYQYAEHLGIPREVRDLARMAEDPKSPATARSFAIQAMMEVDSPQRQELLGRLMEDPTLQEQEVFILSPLALSAPTEFEPFVIQSLENPARRQAAVGILTVWSMRDPKLLFVALPYLSQEQEEENRMLPFLLERAIKSNPQEAVPALIARLERQGALDGYKTAEMLGSLKDPRAIPVLKQMAAEGLYVDSYLGAIIQCGGLSSDEALADLSAWAQQSTLEPAPAGESPIGYGAALARVGPPDEALVVEALGLIGKLPPTAARKLQKAVVTWPGPAAAAYAATQLDDKELFRLIMDHRSQIADSAQAALERLVRSGGRRAGRAAVILGAPLPSDKEQAIGYLEAARWSYRAKEAVKPPIARVLKLRESRDRGLREAAQAYLATVGYDVLEALQATSRVELFSLDPIEMKERKPGEPAVPSAKLFHQFEVLGHARVEGPLKQKLVRALLEDIKSADGEEHSCFKPRHAFRFEHAGHRYDILICFGCERYKCYRDNDRLPTGGDMTATARDVFMNAVRTKGLPAPTR